jgi:hypothetical protein
MVFTKTQGNPDLIGAPVKGARYGANHISTIHSLRYLGVYLDHHLDWTRHVTIMATRARSTIQGINLLGNSVRGLDFLNWHKVFNALVIPGMTYSTPIWYTRNGQKSLVQHLQVAQNKGIQRMIGVFKTTPVDTLHNLT